MSFSRAQLRGGGGGSDTPMHTMQLTTPRFHIQVLVLLKTSYFQEKETTNSVPI